MRKSASEWQTRLEKLMGNQLHTLLSRAGAAVEMQGEISSVVVQRPFPSGNTRVIFYFKWSAVRNTKTMAWEDTHGDNYTLVDEVNERSLAMMERHESVFSYDRNSVWSFFRPEDEPYIRR